MLGGHGELICAPMSDSPAEIKGKHSLTPKNLEVKLSNFLDMEYDLD